MASKGLRAISYQVTRKVEAGYNPSHTTETLIGYTACCAFVHYFIQICQAKQSINHWIYQMKGINLYLTTLQYSEYPVNSFCKVVSS